MANTPITGLHRPVGTEQHLRSHIVQRVDILDRIPGAYLCTSTTRPSTWGANQEGRAIWETDTKLLWHWSGSAWERLTPKGLLGTAARTSTLSTNSGTPVSLVSITVDIPSGGRSVLVVCSYQDIGNTSGLTYLYAYKGSSLWRGGWGVQGDSDTAVPTDGNQGSSMVLIDTPTAGTITYSLRMSTVFGSGGTSFATATSARPVTISVIEV